VKESRSESEAKTRVFEASSGSDSVKSTSTFPKASSFAGRRSTRVFGRPTQRWEPPAPPKRFAGNSGAREEKREGEPASASPLLGPLGPRGLRCESSLSGSSGVVSSSHDEAHGGGAKQGTAWLAAGCLGDLTTRQRESTRFGGHAFTGKDEPYARRARAS